MPILRKKRTSDASRTTTPPDASPDTLKTMTAPNAATIPKATRGKGISRLAPVATPEPAAIARRAFDLYLQDGRVDGRHLEHWLRAERELAGS